MWYWCSVLLSHLKINLIRLSINGQYSSKYTFLWNSFIIHFSRNIHFNHHNNVPWTAWFLIQILKFIKKNPTDATMYQNFIIPYLYKAQHISGDTPPIIRSLKLHWQPLVFHTWKVVGWLSGCAWQCPPTTHPTTFHVWKTRGCPCSFRLLMMGGLSPETCWALYKYGIMKFWYIVASCWIFLYESYYDARIHEHQILKCSSHIPNIHHGSVCGCG